MRVQSDVSYALMQSVWSMQSLFKALSAPFRGIRSFRSFRLARDSDGRVRCRYKSSDTEAEWCGEVGCGPDRGVDLFDAEQPIPSVDTVRRSLRVAKPLPIDLRTAMKDTLDDFVALAPSADDRQWLLRCVQSNGVDLGALPTGRLAAGRFASRCELQTAADNIRDVDFIDSAALNDAAALLPAALAATQQPQPQPAASAAASTAGEHSHARPIMTALSPAALAAALAVQTSTPASASSSSSSWSSSSLLSSAAAPAAVSIRPSRRGKAAALSVAQDRHKRKQTELSITSPATSTAAAPAAAPVTTGVSPMYSIDDVDANDNIDGDIDMAITDVGGCVGGGGGGSVSGDAGVVVGGGGVGGAGCGGGDDLPRSSKRLRTKVADGSGCQQPSQELHWSSRDGIHSWEPADSSLDWPFACNHCYKSWPTQAQLTSHRCAGVE